ncbi:MAG: hypothetical protein ACODAU_06995 [Myxococcota bacterium]
MDRHRLAELTSVELHREVGRRLRGRPEILRRARQRVHGWLETGEVSPYYAEPWARALSMPLDDLCAFLVEDSEHARAMRQVSPFAGALDAPTRWVIWKRLRRTACAP